jgi:hypothetical protein
MYPKSRNQPWLKKGGLIISSLVFVLGSFIAWFLWTQIARPKTFHVPKYEPPFLAIFCGALSILLLVFAAYALRNAGQRAQAASSTPSPWMVGVVTLVFGFPWYVLMTLIFGPRRELALWIPMTGGDRLGRRGLLCNSTLGVQFGLARYASLDSGFLRHACLYDRGIFWQRHLVPDGHHRQSDPERACRHGISLACGENLPPLSRNSLMTR